MATRESLAKPNEQALTVDAISFTTLDPRLDRLVNDTLKEPLQAGLFTPGEQSPDYGLANVGKDQTIEALAQNVKQGLDTNVSLG